MSATTDSIARVARSKAGSTDWRYDTAKGDFPAKTNKCNQFVYDVMVEAGVKPPPTVPKYVVMSRPPTAGEWADVNLKITDWPVVTTPQPGDVVAEAHNYSDATGHVGIVVGPKQTASASALEGGNIVVNDWGFRQDSKPTFRRYSK